MDSIRPFFAIWGSRRSSQTDGRSPLGFFWLWGNLRDAVNTWSQNIAGSITKRNIHSFTLLNYTMSEGYLPRESRTTTERSIGTWSIHLEVATFGYLIDFARSCAARSTQIQMFPGALWGQSLGGRPLPDALSGVLYINYRRFAWFHVGSPQPVRTSRGDIWWLV